MSADPLTQRSGCIKIAQTAAGEEEPMFGIQTIAKPSPIGNEWVLWGSFLPITPDGQKKGSVFSS